MAAWNMTGLGAAWVTVKMCRGPLCGPWFFILPHANPAFSFLHLHFLAVFRALDSLNSAWRFRYTTTEPVQKSALFHRRTGDGRKNLQEPMCLDPYLSTNLSLMYYFRAVLYRRLHPFIFSLHISQYNHPAPNIFWILQFVKIPGLIPDYFVKVFQIPILKTNLCLPVSN